MIYTDLIKTKDKYTELLAEISSAIQGTVYENHVFLVGGAIRDMVLGRKVKNINLVITLEGGGIDFGTWLAHECFCMEKGKNPIVYENLGKSVLTISSINMFSDIEIECTQSMKKNCINGTAKEIKQAFGSLEEDANRRDLTINSIYIDLTTGLVLDPTQHGIEDLKNQTIRATSDIDFVFQDNPLNMLRTIRLASQLHWGIERYTWGGIVKNAHRVSQIQQEKITREINLMLLTNMPQIAFDRLYHSGLLRLVMPEIYAMKGVEQGRQHCNDVYSHTMEVVNKTKATLKLRYSALLHDIAKPTTFSKNYDGVHFYNHEHEGAKLAETILNRMKFSQEFVKSVSTAVKYHMFFKDNSSCPSKKNIRKFLTCTDKDSEITLDLIDADNKCRIPRYRMESQIESIRCAIKRLECTQDGKKHIELPINGQDIMKAFKLKPSPLIGNLLDKVLNVFSDNPSITKEECLKVCSDHLEKVY